MSKLQKKLDKLEQALTALQVHLKDRSGVIIGERLKRALDYEANLDSLEELKKIVEEQALRVAQGDYSYDWNCNNCSSFS